MQPLNRKRNGCLTNSKKPWLRWIATGLLLSGLSFVAFGCSKPVVITEGAQIEPLGKGWFKVNQAYIYQQERDIILLEKSLDECRGRNR